MFIEILLMIFFFLLVFAVFIKVSNSLKQRKIRIEKLNFLSNLASRIELEKYEEYTVQEFKDMYETYLLLYHQNHPSLTEKYGENVVEASTAARERMLTMILWEAYKLIRSKSSDSETWIVKVKEIIDVRASDEFKIQLTTNRLDVEEYELLRELRKKVSEDFQWHDNCNKVLSRLSNAY